MKLTPKAWVHYAQFLVKLSVKEFEQQLDCLCENDREKIINSISKAIALLNC